MKNLNPSEEYIIDQMIKDKTFRLAMVRKSHYWFFHYYFGRKYAEFPTADFHREIFNLTENPDLQNIIITAFRGSAKSTIITLSYVIWSIVGIKQKKFILILGHTQMGTQKHLTNIREELEENTNFRDDFGPFKEEVDQDGTQSILLPQYGANISTRSIGQNIRGIRHFQHRPDLIIADDIEDSDSVRTQENRDKMYDWLTGDVIPAGERNTQLVFIGTPLHNDSTLMRMEKFFKNNDPRNVFRRYPIVDDQNVPLWSGKFKTQKDIDDQKSKIFNNELVWQREYLLKIVDNDYQIIKREHIHYYKELPVNENTRFTAIAVDPAKSLKPGADSTAMVSGKIYGSGNKRKLYILPNPVNAKMTTDQIINKVKSLSRNPDGGSYSRVYVEDINFQSIFVELLKNEGVPAKPFPVRGWSKEDRLNAVSALIELGRVVFVDKGNEELVEQILGFGKEKHDDLVDAMTMLILQMFEDSKSTPSISYIYHDNRHNGDGDIDKVMGITNANWRPFY